MANDFTSARDAAEARLEAAAEPLAKALAKQAGTKPPKTPRERAERRIQEEPDRSEAVIRKLRGLSKQELQRVAEAIDDMLNETK